MAATFVWLASCFRSTALRVELETRLQATVRAQGDLDLRLQAIEGFVRTLSDTLGHMETSRHEAYGELNQQVEAMPQGQTQFAGETRILIWLLHAVPYGWQQEKLTVNGMELHDRVATWASHIERLGNSLSKAVDTSNQSVGSLEHRALVPARRFKEMEVTTEKEVPEISPIERQPRLMSPVNEEATERPVADS